MRTGGVGRFFLFFALAGFKMTPQGTNLSPVRSQ